MIQSPYNFHNTVTYPCGLTINTNLLTCPDPTIVIGGFYKGNTVRRIRVHDPYSRLIVFEPSKYQTDSPLATQYASTYGIQFVPAALGASTQSGTALFGDFTTKIRANQGKYAYGSLQDTDLRDKESLYEVPVVVLKDYLDKNSYKNLSHLHLDIEGAELDVLQQFNSSLSSYTLQVSLELQSSPAHSLLDVFSDLLKLSRKNLFIPIIINDSSMIPFHQVSEFLSDRTAVNIYYIHFTGAYSLCESFTAEQLLSDASSAYSHA